MFASEPYGSHLAEVVGARYVPVDHRRELVPVSATEVRNDPTAHWPYLPSCVRPYYVRRVCLFGPESTGKTALARKLAAHYDTRCVLEYARPLLDFKEGRCDPEDIPRIANGQLASEAALARQANRVLFCDTDVLTTAIWSDVLFGTCPEWVRAAAERQTYDLYLLMDTDIEWEDDGQRFLRAERHLLLERYRRALEGRDRPYLKVSGDYPARFEIARAAVDELLGSGLPGRGPAPVTRARRR